MINKNPQESLNNVGVIDQNVRKNIVELYMALKEAGDKKKAVQILAEHTAILVEMINEFKG